MMEEIAAHLQDHLKNYGVTLKTPRPLGLYEEYRFETGAALLRGNQQQYVTAVFLPDMTLSAVSRAIPPVVHREAPIFVFGPRISPRAADAFRKHQLNYVDQSGNAYIRFGETLIDVRGRPAQKLSHSPRSKPGPRKTLFTPRRSQVIFALLEWPELAYRSIQEIAHHSGTSTGLAHDTISLLTERGFLVNERDRDLMRRDELIDLWASEYPTGLGSASKERRFYGDPHHLVMVDSAVAYVSGEAAVPELLRHQTLTLYMPEFDVRLAGANRWRRAEEDANVFIRPQFWVDPNQPAEDVPHGTALAAPYLLIYADLLSSGDPRQIEVAKKFRHTNALSTTT